jgi:hypothetical protein
MHRTYPIGRITIVVLLLLAVMTACGDRQETSPAPLQPAGAATPGPLSPTAPLPAATAAQPADAVTPGPLTPTAPPPAATTAPPAGAATPGPLAPTAPPPAPTAAQPAAAEPVAPPPPPEVILQDALDALASVDAWHVEIDLPVTVHFGTLTFQIPVTYAGDFHAPGRLEGFLTLKLLGIKFKKDTVLLAKQVEISGTGASQPAARAQPVSFVSLLGFAGLEATDVENLRLVGQESLDGTPVYHLQANVPLQDAGVSPSGAGIELEGELQFDLWTGVADAFPRQASGQGGLATTLGQGELQFTGSAAFSAYGQPQAAATPGPAVPLQSGDNCAAAGSGFVAYANEPAAIRFCYPAAWATDDVVERCGPLFVSPTGVAPGNLFPTSMVLVYPDGTLGVFGESDSGALQVAGRTSLCYFQPVSNTAGKSKVASVLDLARQMAGLLARLVLNKQPVVSLVVGIQSGDAKAMALSYMLDENADRATIEAIIGSILPAKPPAHP